MFDDSFPHLKGEIQARKFEIALLEMLDDPQRVEIVIEKVAIGAHALIQLPLAGVAERRVADVVHEREGFSQIGIEMRAPSHRAGNLRHFQRMREAIAKMIGIAGGENLRFRFQAPESPRMDHAVAVAGVIVSVGMRWFRKAPAARLRARPWHMTQAASRPWRVRTYLAKARVLVRLVVRSACRGNRT